MISHHEHNEDESAKGILILLEQGKSVALVTDAGMPCISDPGYKLVFLVQRAGDRGDMSCRGLRQCRQP